MAQMDADKNVDCTRYGLHNLTVAEMVSVNYSARIIKKAHTKCNPSLTSLKQKEPGVVKVATLKKNAKS